MSSAGFETEITPIERPQTNALDQAHIQTKLNKNGLITQNIP
jgi:hypothetical protein